MKTPLEEFCKDEFHKFISQLTNLPVIIWREGDEPPDYYVDVENQNYAVEVTTLIENIQVGNQTLPQTAIIASLWDTVSHIQEQAKAQNILTGTYTISFSKPIQNFGRYKSRIISFALQYVRDTQYLETAPHKEFEIDEMPLLSINKSHSKSDKIVPLGPSQAKWEGQARLEICQLIDNCLKIKSHKLRNVTLPKILLIYDMYHFANREMRSNCKAQLSLLSNFHTVFIIHSNEESLVLHSDEDKWLKHY